MRGMTQQIADGVHLIDVDNTHLHRSLKSIIHQIVSQLSTLLGGARPQGNSTTELGNQDIQEGYTVLDNPPLQSQADVAGQATLSSMAGGDRPPL